MVKIVQQGHPVLRQIATEVPPADISGATLKSVLVDMKKALNSQLDGVAIAAPQIGIPLRIFIVSGRVFDLEWKETGKVSPTPPADQVFINPEIIKISKEKRKMLEGCLSVRPLYGDVLRGTKATVKAVNENGQEFRRGASGLLAEIFQHEIDHLDGILFSDKAENIHAVEPENEIEDEDDNNENTKNFDQSENLNQDQNLNQNLTNHEK